MSEFLWSQICQNHLIPKILGGYEYLWTFLQNIPIKNSALIYKFPCKYCTKTFGDSQAARKHERRIHSMEKPYSCKHCSKSFGDSSDLTKHERIHTGERPYSCKYCDKTFSQCGHRTR